MPKLYPYTCWIKTQISHILVHLMQDNLSLGFANNNGAEQPANPRSLISVIVIHLLGSIITLLSTRYISIFYQVSVARFESHCARNPKDRFSSGEPHLIE